MLIKKLRPELFHHAAVFFGGRKEHTMAVIEGLIGLQNALKGGDRRVVVNKLADLQQIIPNLILIYMKGDKFDVKYTGRYDYHTASDALITVIKLYMEYGVNLNLYIALKGLTRHVCESLHGIYVDYNISIDEVEELTIKKRAQALAKRYNERRLSRLNTAGEKGN